MVPSEKFLRRFFQKAARPQAKRRLRVAKSAAGRREGKQEQRMVPSEKFCAAFLKSSPDIN